MSRLVNLVSSLRFSFTHDITGIIKRDASAVNKWAALNHEQWTGHSKDPQVLFNFHWSDKPKFNATGCVLTPDSIYGPYWREGQHKRHDIRDGQKGMYLRLAMQIIDVGTCKPLRGAQVGIWGANALGMYSSVKTGYLRGWQSTTFHGTVEFDTNFPGHYIDRASHVHIAVRALKEKRVAHIGQIYFDQWLRNAVEVHRTPNVLKSPVHFPQKMPAYRNNSFALVENLNDTFLQLDTSSKHDPFVRWSKISSNLNGMY